MREHVDLFSGLGCWSIAARANRVRTVALCEREEWLAVGLERTWGCPCYRDVKEFPAEKYRGVWLLTGSPPCQPASRAGKQRGASDDRWLWGPTIRICEVIEPDWFCFENPPGILDVGIDGIISDLEGIGYEVQAVRIPACAVDSPQDRERVWIMGHRAEPGRKGCDTDIHKAAAGNGRIHARGCAAEPTQGALADSTEPRQACSYRSELAPENQREIFSGMRQPERSNSCEPVANSEIGAIRTGLCKAESNHGERKETGRGRSGDGAWSDYAWLPCPDRDGAVKVRRAPVGLHLLAYGAQSRIPRKFHSKLIAALGNAIVWQVAQELIGAMIEAESDLCLRDS